MTSQRKTARSALCALLILGLPPAVAQAGTTGPGMPWDTGLQALIDNLTGTVARLLVIAAIVVAGLAWSFTEHGTGGRKVSQIVFGGAIALAAVTFLAALGFSGAVF